MKNILRRWARPVLALLLVPLLLAVLLQVLSMYDITRHEKKYRTLAAEVISTLDHRTDTADRIISDRADQMRVTLNVCAEAMKDAHISSENTYAPDAPILNTLITVNDSTNQCIVFLTDLNGNVLYYPNSSGYDVMYGTMSDLFGMDSATWERLSRWNDRDRPITFTDALGNSWTVYCKAVGGGCMVVLFDYGSSIEERVESLRDLSFTDGLDDTLRFLIADMDTGKVYHSPFDEEIEIPSVMLDSDFSGTMTVNGKRYSARTDVCHSKFFGRLAVITLWDKSMTIKHSYTLGAAGMLAVAAVLILLYARFMRSGHLPAPKPILHGKLTLHVYILRKLAPLCAGLLLIMLPASLILGTLSDITEQMRMLASRQSRLWQSISYERRTSATYLTNASNDAVTQTRLLGTLLESLSAERLNADTGWDIPYYTVDENGSTVPLTDTEGNAVSCRVNSGLLLDLGAKVSVIDATLYDLNGRAVLSMLSERPARITEDDPR